MPRTGDIYELPSGGAVAGTEAVASDVTTPLADLEADQNLARPISAGGTGSTTAATARTALDAQQQADVLDDLAAVGSLSFFHAAYSGADPDDFILTTGAGLTSIEDGVHVWFVPVAANTTATAATIDSATAVDLKTVTGVDLPPGYLRANKLTHGWMEDGVFYVDRAVETGVSSSVRYYKHADGRLEQFTICASLSSGTQTVTLPVASVDTGSMYPQVASDDNGARSPTYTKNSTTSVTVNNYTPAGSVANAEVTLTINSLWYS